MLSGIETTFNFIEKFFQFGICKLLHGVDWKHAFYDRYYGDVAESF